jgi:hypothetical protein
MSGYQAPNTLYLVLWLVLMVSVLVSRRMPVARSIKLALAWVAIFGTVFILFSVLRA